MVRRKLFFVLPPAWVDWYIRSAAFCLALFSLYTAATLPFDVFVQRGAHLLLVLAMVFWLKPSKWGEADIFLTLLAWLCCGYFLLNWEMIREQSGIPLGIQPLLAVMTVALILEATRRATGLALPILVLCFLIYAKFGDSFPRPGATPGCPSNASSATSFSPPTASGACRWASPRRC